MTMPTSAMILAAGRGERMRPLTDTRPKPLIEVAGKTMLERAYTHIKNAGIQNCVVNAHYLAPQIQNAAQHYAQVSVEDELLDTAGGVLNALPLLHSDSFFVLNGDVVWLDPAESWLQKMAGMWGPSMGALLMLVPKNRAHGYKGRGDFFIDNQGRLRRPLPGEEAPYIYGGVQIVSKSSFESHEIAPFSFNKIWDDLIQSRTLYGHIFDGEWYHIGTPEALKNYEPLIYSKEGSPLKYGYTL